MPVYEYECTSCGQVTEAIRSMRDADEPVACEKCGSAQTSRKHSLFATVTAKSSPAPTPTGGGGCGPGCGCHPY